MSLPRDGGSAGAPVRPAPGDLDESLTQVRRTPRRFRFTTSTRAALLRTAARKSRHEHRRADRDRHPHAPGGVVPQPLRQLRRGVRPRGRQVLPLQPAADDAGDDRLLPREEDRLRQLHGRRRDPAGPPPHPERRDRRSRAGQPRRDDRLRQRSIRTRARWARAKRASWSRNTASRASSSTRRCRASSRPTRWPGRSTK